MIKDHLFRCDSISQQLPLSVGGSVIHSFRLESYVFTCIYNVNTCIIYIVYIYDTRFMICDIEGGRNVEGVERCGRSRRKQSISCRALAHHPANSATLLDDRRILHEQTI